MFFPAAFGDPRDFQPELGWDFFEFFQAKVLKVWCSGFYPHPCQAPLDSFGSQSVLNKNVEQKSNFFWKC